eukprot:238269_1
MSLDNIISKNKCYSQYIAKRCKNKKNQSTWSKKSAALGGYWTPPYTGKSGSKWSKLYRRAKTNELNKITAIQQKNSWIDCEIFRDANYYKNNELILNEQIENIPIWQCKQCTFKNIQRLSFCSMCNMPFDYNHNNNVNNNKFQQFYIPITQLKKKRKRKKRKKRKKQTFSNVSYLHSSHQIIQNALSKLYVEKQEIKHRNINYSISECLLIISNWIRATEIPSFYFSHELFMIIAKDFVLGVFEWKTNKFKNSKIKYSNENLVISNIGCKSFELCVANNLIISRNIYKFYEYEIKILSNIDEMYTNKNSVQLSFGYIKLYKDIRKNNKYWRAHNYCLGMKHQKHRFGVLLKQGSVGVKWLPRKKALTRYTAHFELYGGGKWKYQLENNWRFRKGDVFSVRIDFEKLNICLFYNGLFQDEIFKFESKNDKFIPAVSLYNIKIGLVRCNVKFAHQI